MELLRDWIGPGISQALVDAVEWKSRGAPAAADGDAKFLDDGNSIRIRSSKREFAQITKIEDFSEPVQLWLSDARTCLKAVIAAEATFFSESDLEYGESRRVTDRTLGGLVQLIEYDIVAQPHGSKRTKLSMLIRKLKHIGSDGSGCFGAPCHVESLEPVIEMLSRLQTIRAQESPMSQSLNSFKPSRDHVPSLSQAISMSSADDDLGKSQTLFATQVPGLPSRKGLGEESLKVDQNQPDYDKEIDAVHSPTLTMGGTGGPALTMSDTGGPALAMSGIGGTLVLEQDSIYSSGAEALSLHVNQGDSSEPQGNQDELGDRSKTVSPFAKRNDVSDNTTTAAKDSVAVENHYALLSLLGPPNRAKQHHIQPQATAVTPLRAHQGGKSPMHTSSPLDEGTAAKNLPYQRHVTPAATEANELGMKSFGSSEKSNRVSKSPKVPAPSARFLKAKQQSRKIHFRISSREIRVPKNQKDILDRSDSWCPPEPGKRAPTANIPISILQELNNRAERQVRVNQGSSQASVTSRSLKRDQSSQTASEISGDDIGSSNSDEPIPSADWPASWPERTLLPPDSSAEFSEDPGETDNQGTDSNPELNGVAGAADNLSSSKRTSLSASSSPLSDKAKRQFLQSEAKMRSNSSKSSTNILSSRRELPASADQDSIADWSPVKSPLDSSDETFKNLNDDIGDVQLSTTRPDIPPLKFSRLRNQVTGNSPPRENHSSAGIDGSQANETNLDAIAKPTTAPDLQPQLNAKPISTLYPSSKLIERSLLTHDKIDEQSSKDLSPRTIRNAEAYSGSDSSRKVKRDSPDSDSDLETSIPHGLDRTIDIPSTFYADNGPVLQVDRTPYLHSSLLKPLSASSTEANNGTLHNKAKFETESHKLSKTGGLSAATVSTIRQGAISEQDDNLEVAISTIEETKLPPSIPSRKSTTPGNMQAIKRKASEPVMLSPNVTKRRRAFRAGRAGSEADSRNKIADPRDFGRQHRNEVFARLSEKADHNTTALDIPCSAKEKSSDLDVVSRNSSTVQNHTSELQSGIKSEATLGDDRALSQAFHSLPQSPDMVHETRLEDSYEKPSQHSKIARLDKADLVMHEEHPKDHIRLPKLPKPILQLRKCLIRSYHEGDAESMANQANNLEIAKWMRNAFPHPYRLEDAAAWISTATSASPVLNYAICRPDDNTFIGSIGLKPKDDVSYRTMQVGYWLGEEHWRQGIAKEAVSAFSEWAFEHFKQVLRLEAEVYEGNNSSVRVLEKAGYTFEAKNKNAIEKMGVVRSVLVFCRFSDSQVCHERKPSPNLVLVAEQGVADVNPASDKDNATKDPNIIGSDLTKPRLHFDENKSQADHTVPSNLFDRFRVAYPEYPGNEGHFAAICKKIGSLVRNNSMEHPSLWDDFAFRHRTEYTHYLIQCTDEAIDPLPYERFYREKISQTKYSCSTGLVLTRNSILDFLPQEESRSASLISNQSVPQSTEVDNEVSAESPTSAGREVANDANNSKKWLPDSDPIDDGQISKGNGAGLFSSKTHPIGPNLPRQQFRLSSHEKSSRSSRNDTRSSFSLGAEKLYQDIMDSEGGNKKEVIELTSDSEDQQSSTRPRRPATSRPNGKCGRRSLPWTGTNSQSIAKPSDTVKIAASTPTPSVPTHGRQLSASTSKAGTAKESRPFAAFRSAKSGQEDLIEIPAPTIPKPSKEKSAEQSTTEPTWIDDEHAPFRTFARHYQAITPGKGNSFAKDLPQGNSASKRKPKMKEKLVDPLSWEL